MTNANFILTLIVVGFWTVILIQVRRRTRVISLNLLATPLAFEMLGVLVNSYRAWWGTYSVVGIHVLLLSILLGRAGRGK
jgi:carbon starvation protein CstA